MADNSDTEYDSNMNVGEVHDDLELMLDNILDAPQLTSSGSSELSHARTAEDFLIDRKEFNEALDKFYTQTQNYLFKVPCGEPVEPRSDFEKAILNIGIALRVNDSGVYSTFLVNHNSHCLFVRHLDEYFDDEERMVSFLRLFEVELESVDALKLYLSPLLCDKGQTDTFFRALLLSKRLQGNAFNILMCKAEYFAKSDTDDKAAHDHLALACIAHIRYLDVIYDPHLIFNSIFDCDLENWRCVPRDSLIQSLPEIIPNVSVQQDIALNLQQMFMKEVRDKSVACRAAILRALTDLRTDTKLTADIRNVLMRNMMKFQIELLPEIVKYCLESVEKDERSVYKNIIISLRTYLHVEHLTADDKCHEILRNIFRTIARKAKFSGYRYWKEMNDALRSEADIDAVDGDLSSTIDELQLKSIRVFVPFDMFLCLSLMDVENCDRTIYTIFRSQINLFRHQWNELEEMIDRVLSCTSFTTRFFSGILKFATHLMYTFYPQTIHCGRFLYEQLFVHAPMKRDQVLTQLLRHLNDIDSEATATLIALQNLTKNHMDLLRQFSTSLYKTLSSLRFLSIENIRKLFQVLIMLGMESITVPRSQEQDDFKIAVEKMLLSTCKRENVWGVLGMIMIVNAQLKTNCLDENRESYIERNLLMLDRKTETSPEVRALFFHHMTLMVDENPRMALSTSLIDWSDNLHVELKSFFGSKSHREISEHELELEEFIETTNDEWLELNELVIRVSSDPFTSESIYKLFSLFNLLRSIAVQNLKWNGNDTQEAYLRHWSQFLFALEANISMSGATIGNVSSAERALTCDILYYAIEWIRLLINTFADCNVDNVFDERVMKLVRKRFYLMLKCQRWLSTAIKGMNEYVLPSSKLCGSKKLTLKGITPVKRSKKMAPTPRKRTRKGALIANRTDENMGHDKSGPVYERATADVGDITHEYAITNEEEETRNAKLSDNLFENKNNRKCRIIDASRMLLCFSPLKLKGVVKLLLMEHKRKATFFLLDELHKILNSLLLEKEKHPVAVNLVPLPSEVSIDHGDKQSVWEFIHSSLNVVSTTLRECVEYFQSFPDSSSVKDLTDEKDVVKCLHASLQIFRVLFECHRANDADVKVRENRCNDFMTKVERALISYEGERDCISQNSSSETRVLKYFVAIGPILPTLDCVITLLYILSSFVSVSEDERLKMAQLTLSFLKKDWMNDCGNKALKGPAFNKAVSTILERYIFLRDESKRLLVIQWILANKVSLLVPEVERRRSKISSMEHCHDEEIENSSDIEQYGCLTKNTFYFVYKVLFHCLNECVKYLSIAAVNRGELELDECLEQWKKAASSFCLLALLIRIKNLRNNNVLICAAREGRIFLRNITCKSSFMRLLDSKRFAKYATSANAVLKTVQIGNRSLQNISVYAKSTKCAALLRLLPELRATSELFIRTVHSIMIGVSCDEAFQIGLLKSRNLDGEEVKEDEAIDPTHCYLQLNSNDQGDENRVGTPDLTALEQLM